MAKKTKVQVNLEYYAVRVVFFCLGILPRRAAVGICIFFCRLAYLVLGRHRRIAFRNTEIAFPEMSAAEREKLVRGCFRSLGRLFGEMTQFPKHTKEDLEAIIEFPIADELWTEYRKLKEQGRGMIFLTPHLGGWEILAFATSALIEPQTYLVRRLDNRRLENFLGGIRGRFGNRPMDKMNAALPALHLLSSGGNLGILADINTQPRDGVFVPFFGKPACTTAGVAMLAMRANAVVVTIGAPWDEKKGKYVARIGRALEFESTGDRQRDIENFTALFTADIEKMVRDFPEQWFWVHRRWKTRPEGEPDLYGKQ